MKLIINADDYGCSVPVSLGILEGMRYGVITSTSALVPARDFLYCAEYALEHGITHMGCHAMLTMLTPTLPASEIPSLVNEDGRMYGRKEFMEREIDVREAEAELENQIRIFLSTGLRLDHIDTHHGLMRKNEEFAEMILRLAGKYEVPLRNERCRFYAAEAPCVQRKCEQGNVRMPDVLYFNHGKPYHTTEDIICFLENAKERYDIVEIGCHPGHSDAYLRAFSTLNDDREKELEVMLDMRLRRYIEENGIEMIDYDGL